MISLTGPAEAGDLSALSPWANELAQTFVSLASDIALVVDAGGVIRNVAQRGGEPLAPAAAHWIGQAWADTVTGETRRKVELLMQEVADTGLARRREVNHPSSGGSDIPVAYTAIRLGAAGPVLAVGRDLRAIAAIQQRFIDTQQELERGYWKARQAESRERQLVQVASDAVLVVDATSLAIVAANDAAAALFDIAPEALTGCATPTLFDAHSRGPIDELMAAARSSGRPLEIRARLAQHPATTSVSATPFRSGDAQRLLVRVRPDRPADGDGATHEAVCITDSSGRVLSCSPAFATLTGLYAEAQVQGRLLSEWLGATDREPAMLLAEVRSAGLVEAARSVWRRNGAAAGDVELSATLLTEGDQECIGLVVTPVAPVATAAAPGASFEAALAVALAQVDLQFGAIDLPQMLRDAALLTERHVIAGALARCDGDATAAAALLGISRATLLRRRRRTAAGRSAQPGSERP
jgi:transcriptional regulator PpsR